MAIRWWGLMQPLSVNNNKLLSNSSCVEAVILRCCNSYNRLLKYVANEIIKIDLTLINRN